MRSYERQTVGIVGGAAVAGFVAAANPAAGVPMTLLAAAASISPPRRVTFTSAADVSAASFTIVGRDRAGKEISEVVVGPNATTVTSTKVYASITSITPSASVAQDVSAGYSAEVIGGWMPLGQGHSNFGYGVDVVGTVNYDIEKTYRNILREGINGDYEPSAMDLETAKTAAVSGVIEGGVGSIRIVQNSGTGTVTLRVVPAEGK